VPKSEIILVPALSFPFEPALAFDPISGTTKTNIHCFSKERKTTRDYI